MNKPDCIIEFSDPNYPPLKLPKNSQLADYLTIQNSPILFGCRTGICGTCLVNIEGEIPPPLPAEKELLELLSPGNPKARLACQIHLTNDINITLNT